jgi:hypothetical protein
MIGSKNSYFMIGQCNKPQSVKHRSLLLIIPSPRHTITTLTWILIFLNYTPQQFSKYIQSLHHAAQTNELGDVWQDGSFVRPSLLPSPPSQLTPSQLRRLRSRRSRPHHMGKPYGGRIILEIQPGATKTEFGESKGETGGFRSFCE